MASAPSTRTPPKNPLLHRSGIGLAAMVVSIIAMMALPLPPWTLDILVAMNISAGVMLLLTALYMPSPLAFSTFPAVLLLTTLFRISLNVATSRQILLKANGGEIIDAFGHMVVGGSLVVGLVIFLIITVVQFIVVAKGAERVAEVGARFTLDALPGKQMSIDADLRAGTISQKDAVRLRQQLVQESQFYGAMDGAMKFVKGDAIAGIVIVAVNLLGGISIGTLSLGMSLADAIHRYAVLSIGDGLVSQVPALFVSIAAGVAITRSAPDNSTHLGEQISRQLASEPHAVLLSAGVMALFALVPGFPALTFGVLAAATALLGWRIHKRQQEKAQAAKREALPAAAREGESTAVSLQVGRPATLSTSTFRLDLSRTLLERVGSELLDQALHDERAALRENFGMPFPGLDLRINDRLPDNSFQIRVQSLVDTTVTLSPNGVLVLGFMGPQRWEAFDHQHRLVAWPFPRQLGTGRWVEEEHIDSLQSSASPWPLEVLQPHQLIARMVMNTVQRNPTLVLGVQEVRHMLRTLEDRYADLIREAQVVVPLGRLADCITALARERVPLTDFAALLQAISTRGPFVENSHELHEAMRKALARGIVASVLPISSLESLSPPALAAITLSPDLEAKLLPAKVMQADGPVLGLPPAWVDSVRTALQAAFEQAAEHTPRVLALPIELRRALDRLYRTDFPHVAFMSHDELTAAEVVAQEVAQAQLPTLA